MKKFFNRSKKKSNFDTWLKSLKIYHFAGPYREMMFTDCKHCPAYAKCDAIDDSGDCIANFLFWAKGVPK